MRTNKTTVIWFDYMDNLRAIALLVGILFHTAMAYSPMSGNIWPAANQEQSITLDFAALFPHMFRMPLFFLISGFFAHMLLEKRGLNGFIKNRLVRIFIPLAVFLPLIALSLVGGILWAIEVVEHPSPVLEMMAAVLIDPENNESPLPLSTGHLWFLYNLLMFCGLLALIWKVKLANSRWLSSLATPKFVVFILPLLLIPALSSVAKPYPPPDSFSPELWSFGFFGIFFLLGFTLYSKQSLLDELKPYAPFLCVISIALYSYSFLQIKDVSMTIVSVYEREFSWSKLPLAGAEAFVSVYMTVWCLVIGKQYLNRKNKLLRIISKSSYWVYIVHLPILLMIQYSMMNIELGIGIEYLIGSLGTLAIGLASYYIFVKPTPIGWILNGKPRVNKS